MSCENRSVPLRVTLKTALGLRLAAAGAYGVQISAALSAVLLAADVEAASTVVWLLPPIENHDLALSTSSEVGKQISCVRTLVGA